MIDWWCALVVSWRRAVSWRQLVKIISSAWLPSCHTSLTVSLSVVTTICHWWGNLERSTRNECGGEWLDAKSVRGVHSQLINRDTGWYTTDLLKKDGRPSWWRWAFIIFMPTFVNSAFHPSWVSKSGTILSSWGFTCVWCQVTLAHGQLTPGSSEVEFYGKNKLIELLCVDQRQSVYCSLGANFTIKRVSITVFFKLFFEVEPFAPILIARGTSWWFMYWCCCICSWTSTTMTSNALTHECHNCNDHNFHKVHSLNTKYVFQWNSSGLLGHSWNFFSGQWWSGRTLGCHWQNP